MIQENKASPEPWLRGTLNDLHKWCEGLTDTQLNTRPAGIAPVTFHLRHIARSLDRLLTYAEGAALSEGQIAAIETELESGVTGEALFSELDAALARSARRVRALASADFGAHRSAGRKQLQTTLGGLMVHVADHTQRHVGQAITTAKIVASL